VRAAETAFAQSMADRDFAAFASFIADDAIFVNGTRPRNGKAAILAAWEEYFTGPVPFSWRPETVVVLATGQLAQTKGPVFDPAGNHILEFRSTWRREADGEWKIVFDDGTCKCAARAAAAE
jgi:ketosteroid isomerase-like protein